MTIGIDISAIGERSTGTSRYIHCLLTQLKATGNEILSFPAQPLKQLSQTHWLQSVPMLKRGGIDRHLYRLFQQGDEMNKADVECAIFPNYLKPLNFHKPSLIVIYDLSFFSHPQFYSRAFVLFYKDQLKRVLKSDPLIAALSNNSKESIHRYLGVPKDRIFLLQPYMDTDVFKQMPDRGARSDARPYFLYVGHIEPRKNLSFLIRNFIDWKTAHGISITLKIVGDLWRNSAEIRALLSQYSECPDVEFTGYVDEEELHQLYAHAAAFVHSSIVEGFGFPVLEAMYYKLPVLCSSGTSTEEISRPYSIAVAPRDDAALLAGFDRLFCRSMNSISDPQIRYSPQLMRSQLDRVLERLTGRKFFYSGDVPHAEVETAVQKTLLYYKLFNGGLSIDAIHTYLLDLKVSRRQLDEAVESLIQRRIVNLSKNILSLNADVRSFYVRKQKSLDGKLTSRLLKILNNIPFITAIAFSGGTANYGLENHDDIDLFIITKPYTIYLVYLLIHAISLVMKCRNILCINYLVDENAVEINLHRDLYTAHQIIALKAFKNGKFLQYFLNKNSWIVDHYPNYPIPDSRYPDSSTVYTLFRPVNWLLKIIYQRWYREVIGRADQGSIVLSDNVMKLHTRDYRNTVITEFEMQWLEYMRRPVED
jgi:glycosyltransferase involved in cell wall biosynthesis